MELSKDISIDIILVLSENVRSVNRVTYKLIYGLFQRNIFCLYVHGEASDNLASLEALLLSNSSLLSLVHFSFHQH